MAIKNDYLLDQIARFVEGILASIDRMRSGRAADAVGGFEAVVGDVLDMDPETALSLSPASLVTMMQLSAVDGAWPAMRSTRWAVPPTPTTPRGTRSPRCGAPRPRRWPTPTALR